METTTRNPVTAAPGSYLGFRLGAETYGLDIGVVQEISGMLPVTRVPGAPDHVRGVVNLRGRVVQVVDLRRLFGMEAVPETRRTSLVVCRIEDGEQIAVAAAIVDDVTEVLNIDAAAIAPHSGGGDGAAVAGLAQLGGAVVILLDAARVFFGDEPGGAA